jgi:hypothetical protein
MALNRRVVPQRAGSVAKITGECAEHEEASFPRPKVWYGDATLPRSAQVLRQTTSGAYRSFQSRLSNGPVPRRSSKRKEILMNFTDVGAKGRELQILQVDRALGLE